MTEEGTPRVATAPSHSLDKKHSPPDSQQTEVQDQTALQVNSTKHFEKQKNKTFSYSIPKK